MTNKKKIIWICLLIVIVLIATTYFLFFKKDNIIILYIEGIDIKELDKYTHEQLPNLKQLYSKKINTEVPLNNPSSFLTILSGKYIYQPWFEKNRADYCVQKENNFQDIFNNTELNKYAMSEHWSVNFINGLDWDLEKRIHQHNFNSSEIITQAHDNFIIAKNELINYLEKKQDNLIVFGVNYPAMISQIFADDNDILKAYKEIDNLINELKNLMKKNTDLFIISPFGFVNVDKTIDINNALVYRGFLKGDYNAEKNYSINDCDLAKSFSYSPRAGEIFVNKKQRENLGQVDDDFKAVIEDTAYILSFIDYQGDKLIDAQLYDTKEYFTQDNLGELLIAMPEGYNIFWPENNCLVNNNIIMDTQLIKEHLNIKPNLIPGIILSNKNFIEDLYQRSRAELRDRTEFDLISGEVQKKLDYLNVLDLILEDFE